MLQNKSLLQSHPSWSGYLSGICHFSLFQNKQTLLFLSVFWYFFVFFPAHMLSYASLCTTQNLLQRFSWEVWNKAEGSFHIPYRFYYCFCLLQGMFSLPTAIMPRSFSDDHLGAALSGVCHWLLQPKCSTLHLFFLVFCFSRWFLLLIFKYNVCSSPAFWISSVHLPNFQLLDSLLFGSNLRKKWTDQAKE